MTQEEIGLRERKRQETLRRITDAGICLFLDHGFDAVTIDQIAVAAGISRRTFFHYFKAKDDILLSLQNGMGAMIAEGVKAAPAGARPLDAVRDATIAVCAAVPAEDMIGIDRMMRGSASVQARKQVSYVEQEATLFAALRERWSDPARADGLRMVALLAIGAIRLSADRFTAEEGRRPIPEFLADTFQALAAELDAPAP